MKKGRLNMENYEGFIDYYQILDISRNATEEEIKTAYRQLAKEYHPDKHAGESKERIAYYEQLFKRIQDAYDHLGNESKNNNRAEYNILYDKYHAAGHYVYDLAVQRYIIENDYKSSNLDVNNIKYYLAVLNHKYIFLDY